MPRAQHEPFEEQRVVAEARGGLTAGAGHGVGHVLGALDDVHALAAAAGARLDEDGETDLARGRDVRLMTPQALFRRVAIAEAITWMATRPRHVNIDLMVIKPRAQAAAHKVHRE